MAPVSKDEELIRSYLLGKLSEQEQEDLEERIMIDREFSDLACVIESMLVEDYLEGALEEQDRRRFEKLLLATTQGAEQVRFALALKEYASTRASPVETLKPHQGRPQSPFWFRRWALVAAVLLIAFGVWRIIPESPIPKSPIEEGLAALGKAYPERPVDVRITALDYAPRLAMRGGAGEKVDEYRLRQAELILGGEATEDPGAESFHALGRLYLAKREFRQAINYFTDALELDPTNARIHSDLGAAYLELGKDKQTSDRDDRPSEFDRSLQHLNRALELRPGLPDALFNRALLYKEMLPREEAAAWEEYLRIDQSSPWAAEARNRLSKAIENK